MVASAEICLESEGKDVQRPVFLPFVPVFEKTRITLERSEDCVVPGPGQCCNMAGGATKTLTSRSFGQLFVGEEEDAWTS